MVCLIVDDFLEAKSSMFNRLPDRINIMVCKRLSPLV